ncbi:hypothetical protein GLOIN_2v1471124 [Rhizophagus irregularis DAOM 181602=DAOM 197198]|nr:hypothetical protein GLOIN_2v1471124 [Rhizophagus irregularis DAOM 181602=DAOM 197198]POG80879.1 hypothetical protein GLOIN_2v1471124 [Rhizophagus irregularis DAOM 181602=DAOM 197198]|eukprot:XP_025187745.1 hypothetical protein GLOIN_2v1471124 [Rhizophagus irregularis DAOM 181602=DAOM 197198]
MDYNVIIHTGEEPNFKEFHVHSIILRCRSEYFNNLFSTENIEKRDGKYIIKRPNISPQAFDIIIKYLYTGQFDITDKTGADLIDFMIAFGECMLNDLTKFTEDFMFRSQQQFLQDDPVGILQIIYCYKIFARLQEYCLNKICSEPKILFSSNKFTQLSVPLLEIILKRDDLNLKEIEIWESLIKWGLAQEHVFNRDVTRWNQNDINTFKKIVDKFIPLIRFYDISTRDYFNKVKPYEEILSKELRDDILKFYMVPEYKPVYTPRNPRYINGSIIIGQEHFTTFANWIDREEENTNYIDIPYEFILLYRSSRDGNTAAAFHAKCDRKGATIVVVRIANSERIVGGYNPLFWDSDDSSYIGTYVGGSFIFSFTNENGLRRANVAYSNNWRRSVYSSPINGPGFGYGDLYVNYVREPSVWYSVTSCYPTINLPNTMSVDDYEVFQVIKKSLD